MKQRAVVSAAILAGIGAAFLVLRSHQKASINKALAQLSREDIHRMETIFQRQESFIG